jgi:protein involved in polysaccharide export with SLBB domain
MSQQLTTVDAILLAGGLAANAGAVGFLHRQISGTASASSPAALVERPDVARTGSEVIQVDLQALREGRFLSAAVPLRSGDVLVVPIQPMQAFFVVGDVRTPQNYVYPPARSLTASQAISWAGGPLPTASMSNGMLVRYDAQGRRTEMKVDYAAILDGRQLDFAIQPNDIIFIPGSKVKTIAHGMLLMTDTMMMQQSFRIGRRVQMPESPGSIENR